MTNKTLYSFIVPLYLPYKEYIVECIESIKRQTLIEFECILVLPNTQKNAFSSLNLVIDSRFKVVTSDSTNQSTNRNIGIKYSIGKYLIFVDCDDIIDSNYLLVSNYTLSKLHCDFLCFNNTRDFAAFNNYHKKFSLPNFVFCQEEKQTFFNIFNNIKSSTNINLDTVWAKVFRANVIKKNSILFYEDTSCGEDVLFVREYVHFVSNIIFVENYYSYYWRINNKSLMSKIGNFYDINNFLRHIDKLPKLEKIEPTSFNNYKMMVLNLRISKLCNFYLNKEVSKNDLFLFLKKVYGKNSYAYGSINPDIYIYIYIYARLVMKHKYILLKSFLFLLKMRKMICKCKITPC